MIAAKIQIQNLKKTILVSYQWGWDKKIQISPDKFINYNNLTPVVMKINAVRYQYEELRKAINTKLSLPYSEMLLTLIRDFNTNLQQPTDNFEQSSQNPNQKEKVVSSESS